MKPNTKSPVACDRVLYDRKEASDDTEDYAKFVIEYLWTLVMPEWISSM